MHVAHGGAPRRGRRADQHVLDRQRAARRSSRNADLHALVMTGVSTTATTTLPRSQRAFPRSTSRAPSRRSCPMCPTSAAPFVTEDPTRLPAAGTIPDDWLDRLEADVTPERPPGHRPHFRVHDHAQGRDPPARPPVAPPRQPQRRARPDRRRTRLFSNSPLFWIGGLGWWGAVGELIAGATLICSSEEPHRTLDLIERRTPRHGERLHPSGSRRSVQDNVPSLAHAQLLLPIRTGNLYPIMPPTLQPSRPTPKLHHDVLGLAEPRQRRAS